jgi:hypothetical protein
MERAGSPHRLGEIGFSPDGRFLGSCFGTQVRDWPRAGKVDVWSVPDGKLVTTITNGKPDDIWFNGIASGPSIVVEEIGYPNASTVAVYEIDGKLRVRFPLNEAGFFRLHGDLVSVEHNDRASGALSRLEIHDLAGSWTRTLTLPDEVTGVLPSPESDRLVVTLGFFNQRQDQRNTVQVWALER